MSLKPIRPTEEELEKIKKHIENDPNLDKDWLAYRDSQNDESNKK